MSISTWGLVSAWGLLIFLFVAAIVAAQQNERMPQARPFNVYQSGNYCVYIASNQAGIAMQVVSNYGATCQ